MASTPNRSSWLVPLALAGGLVCIGCRSTGNDSASVSEPGASAPAEPEAPSEPAQPPAEAEPPPKQPDAIVFEIPEDAPTNESPCEERRRFANDTVATLVQAASATCLEDTDCKLVDSGTPCMGACPVAIKANLEEEFSAAKTKVEQRVCEGYQEASCPYATPRCMNMAAACQEGRCVIVDARG